jgi:cell division protein ZapA
MAEVQLQVGGRSYGVHCRDGEEARLHQLARMISDRVDKVKQSSPGMTEVRQLLFAALLLADDLTEMHARKASEPASGPAQDDSAALHALESLAERLESIGDALAGRPAAA